MMDCNKEEATRAKDIALKKMHNRDFIGARKIALKAQQLFPDLENLSQMLTVCDVHCSAAVKVNGEMDWYGILHVESMADDLLIKKQYRKLALLLHPDKNQFTGAEEAFKLIGEAHMTLSDRGKRSLYDMKRNGSIKVFLPKQPAQQSRKRPYARNNFTTVNFNVPNQQQQQHPTFNASQTFWTACSSCHTRYQYFRNILNKTLRCQNCLSGFVAYDINAKVVPPNTSASTFPQESMNRRAGFNSDNRDRSTTFKMDAKVDIKHANYQNNCPIEDQGQKSAKVKIPSVSHKKGRKSVVSSSESEDSNTEDSSTEEDIPNKSTAPTSTPRRSTRFKQKVAYNEDGSEDDDNHFVNPRSKKLRGESSTNIDIHDNKLPRSNKNSEHTEFYQQKGSLLNGKEYSSKVPKGNEHCKYEKVMEPEDRVNSSSNDSPDARTFSYPDPEFFDFDESRSVNQFAVDQIWAVYDTLDGMPRFYARIRKVYGPGFKLNITWLESCPRTNAEKAWVKQQLPVACGNFSLGHSEHTEDQLMFSHVVSWEKGRRKNSYDLYPRKGEAWALFKGWSMEWSSDSDNHKVYQYDVVEVISDFAASTGVTVVPLVKIEGFVSLFMHAKDIGAAFVIPAGEMLRFSHNVPAYRLFGTEREGVPKGSLELDPASLPANFQDVFPSISLGVGTARREKPDECTPPCSKNTMTKKDIEYGRINQSENKSQKDKIDVVNLEDGNAEDDDNLSQTSSPVAFDYPVPEFNDFSCLRGIEKFQQGQIWALYCDIDEYPKYYARVKKVELDDIRIHVVWLEACPMQEEEKHWSEKNLPLSCGTFEVSGVDEVFESTESFSHLVDAKQTHKEKRYAILPRSGEIWAIYKNWKVGWNLSDLKNCLYDVVQVLEATDLGVKVIPLMKLPGYRAVFKPESDEKPQNVITIPFLECIRFSHMIPASKLTAEKGGKLRGYWELDTASVPQPLLFENS